MVDVGIFPAWPRPFEEIIRVDPFPCLLMHLLFQAVSVPPPLLPLKLRFFHRLHKAVPLFKLSILIHKFAFHPFVAVPYTAE
jgi:hypothetical protein